MNETEARLFWRDELLQVMYWLQGEGFSDLCTLADLARFLQAESGLLAACLHDLVQDGYLEVATVRPDGQALYRLTAVGRREGGRRFAEEFAHLQRPAHFECSPDCPCRLSGNPADCPTRREGVHE